MWDNENVRRPRDAKLVIWAVKKCIICKDPLSHLTKSGAEWVRKEGPAPKLPAHHLTYINIFYKWNYQTVCNVVGANSTDRGRNATKVSLL